jgi:hypothetical protein
MFNCRVYFHVKIRLLNLSFDPVYVKFFIFYHINLK